MDHWLLKGPGFDRGQRWIQVVWGLKLMQSGRPSLRRKNFKYVAFSEFENIWLCEHIARPFPGPQKGNWTLNFMSFFVTLALRRSKIMKGFYSFQITAFKLSQNILAVAQTNSDSLSSFLYYSLEVSRQWAGDEIIHRLGSRAGHSCPVWWGNVAKASCPCRGRVFRPKDEAGNSVGSNRIYYGVIHSQDDWQGQTEGANYPPPKPPVPVLFL